MRDRSSVAEIRAQAEEVAAGGAAPGSPDSWRLTAALFRVIAADTGLLSELATLPADRLPALLASAAISFLVRRDRPEPLAGYFPAPGAPQPPFDEGFFPAARGFLAARRWLQACAPPDAPALTRLAAAIEVRSGVFAVLGARTFHGGTDQGRVLARAHPSGQWVEWLGAG